jgi:antitoxin component of MazEF toxin-antitoxin module
VQIFVQTPQRIRKVGNSLVVTIPADVAAQHHLRPDDLVKVTVEPVEQITIPRLPAELQRALDQVLEDDRDALRYLGGKPVAEDRRS